MPAKFGRKRRRVKKFHGKGEDQGGAMGGLDGDERLDESHRPSALYRTAMLESFAIEREPMPVDPPSLYRIYRSTVQRVPLNQNSLASRAAFLLLCDEDKKILAWFGSESDPFDRQITLQLGSEIAKHEYSAEEEEEIPVVIEDMEHPVHLKYLLGKCYTDEKSYKGKVTRGRRFRDIENSPMAVSVLEKVIGTAFVLREVSRGNVDEDGSVPRISFAPIEKASIVVSHLGDEWNMWIARGVSRVEEENAKNYLLQYITNFDQLSRNQRAEKTSNRSNSPSRLDSLMAAQNLRIIRQGCERILFRIHFKLLTDFEPPHKTISSDSAKKSSKFYEFTSSKDSIATSEIDNDKHNGNTELDANDSGLGGLPSEKGADSSKDGVLVSEEDLTSAKLSMDPKAAQLFVGSRMLSSDMMDIHELSSDYEEVITDPAKRNQLIAEAAIHPNVLMGWQIEIDDGKYSGVHVVTGMKKSVFRQTWYRISDVGHRDIWVRLKRTPRKKGTAFRPLRKVLDL